MRTNGGNPPSGEEMYAILRRQVLDLSPDQLGVDATILALLAETGYAEAVATLVAVVDGTTSLYFSNGGGVIGAGTHEAVRVAAERLLELAAAELDQLSPVDEPGLPAVGRTQFVAVTPMGLLAAQADESDLAERRHELSPLFYATHDVITQVRLVEGG
jgi:hypothetical protein